MAWPKKIGLRWLVCLLLAAVPLGIGVLRAADTTVPATRPTTGEALSDLQQKAEDLLAAQDYKSAITAFGAAVAKYPKSVRGLHGLGLAYLLDKQYVNAAKYLRSAFVMAGTNVSPNLLANTVLAECQTHQPERGISRAMAYLKKHLDAPNEPAVNSLGFAVGSLPDIERTSPAAGAARDFYLEVEQKLTPPRQGWKRMAGGWTAAADEAAARKQGFTQAVSDLLAAQRDIVQIQSEPNRRGKAAQEAAALSRLADANNRYTQYSPFPQALDPLPLDTIDTPTGTPTVIQAVPQTEPVDIATTVAPPPNFVKPAEDEQERRGTAVAVSPNLVVTAAEAVKGAKKITLIGSDGKPLTAEVVRRDDATKLALLRVTGRPMKYLAVDGDFAGGKVRCLTYDNVGLFSNDADSCNGMCKSVAGDTWNIALDDLPKSPGAPVIDDNRLIGIEMMIDTTKADSVPTISGKRVLKMLGSDLPADAAANANASNAAQAVLRVIVSY